MSKIRSKNASLRDRREEKSSQRGQPGNEIVSCESGVELIRSEEFWDAICVVRKNAIPKSRTGATRERRFSSVCNIWIRVNSILRDLPELRDA